MAPVIRIDDDVMEELKKKAIELNMVFATPNEVLKTILKVKENMLIKTIDLTFPQSEDANVQKLIDGIRSTILRLSPNGLCYYPKSGKWVATPDNFVAVKVQDKRSKNIAIIVYGNPDEFRKITHNLNIKPDRPGYSRFNIDNENQIQSAIEVIKEAYNLKA